MHPNWAASDSSVSPSQACFVSYSRSLVRRSRMLAACSRGQQSAQPWPTTRKSSTESAPSSIPQCGYPIVRLKRRLLFQNRARGPALVAPSPVTAFCSPPHPSQASTSILPVCQHPHAHAHTRPPDTNTTRVRPATASPSFFHHDHDCRSGRIQRAYAR
jgi:hypothetical protein